MSNVSVGYGLLDRGDRLRFLEAERSSLFQNVQSAFEAYQVSYSMVSGRFIQQTGRGNDPLPPSRSKIKNT
jgi:hypothetical protein